jgi:hypothetical protein
MHIFQPEKTVEDVAWAPLVWTSDLASVRPVAGVIGGSFGQTGRRIDYVVLRVREYSVMLCIVFISWCCCNFALQPMLLVSAIYLCYLSHSIATSSLRWTLDFIVSPCTFLF